MYTRNTLDNSGRYVFMATIILVTVVVALPTLFYVGRIIKAVMFAVFRTLTGL